ncbi:peptide chain release factor N(5)-glutamine methyltransferase [Sphingomonas soli]|uniref:peptide chain release factor N(5)-glutamine methyltransferase n=1 Tax=Sphingomonas soli TaxID=266127 RepID=UPI0009FB9596|nr:peptide chain release factor N(5)-glutamine methyltransferase [Sphingomonas soli]
MAAALTEAAARLAMVSDTPRLDSELLMAHALGVERDTLLLRHMGEAAPEEFAALIERRMGHEPLAYITGTRGFWNIDLAVGPGVLIPRPDSEALIEAALEHFGDAAPATMLDLGTGPGTLLLAALAEWPEAKGLGVDASETALDYARRNAEALGLAGRAVFQLGDWAAGIDGRFDLILCNPPYIGEDEAIGEDVRRFEPHTALFAGAEGLDDYRRIIPDLRRLMAEGGAAVLEIGWTQADAVTALGAEHGFTTRVRNDLGDRPRAVLLT